MFSINCYSFDPTAAIQNIVDSKVDLPIMIGEFHFGALDAGPSSIGLEGVGCHCFQCYDQFTLGRFDGENYNIGLFDICSQLYPEMMSAVKDCSSVMYEVAAGEREPVKLQAKETAMVAF